MRDYFKAFHLDPNDFLTPADINTVNLLDGIAYCACRLPSVRPAHAEITTDQRFI
jgi:hypothetical protein